MSEEDKWVRLSFRVTSKTMLSSEMERIVGLEAFKKADAGDRISKRSESAGAHDRSMCVFRSPLAETEELSAHVKWIADLLRDRRSLLERLSGQCEFDVRIGFASGSGQGGFALNGQEIAVLGELNVELFIDLYPPSQGDG